MYLIWGMMNDLSFLISLSMVSIQIPGIASAIQSLLLQIIYMDLLMTDKWLTPLLELQLFPEEDEENEAINLFFNEQGFQSRLLIFNLGSTLVFIAMHIMLLLITLLVFYMRKFSRIATKLYGFLSSRLIWAGTIRFIIQQFQPLLMSSIINISSYKIADLSRKSLETYCSYALSVIILAALIFSTVAFTLLIKNGKASDREFAPLMEGIRTSVNRSPSYAIILTLLKWTILCLILILLTDYPAQQLQLLIILASASTLYQLSFPPQSDRQERWMTSFNEVMSFLYVLAQLSLTLTADIQLRQYIALAMLALLLGTVFINLVKVLAQVCILLFRKSRKNRDRVMVLKKYAEEKTEEGNGSEKVTVAVQRQQYTRTLKKKVHTMAIPTEQILTAGQDIQLQDIA
ncbi:hypothetical protein FGO68_gene11043 [Halteria grandinella]|uniref:TRP C-terminal domain-containing protein n=1 Tax=Halteria grandinella TaxID=5974 RepID=A0A8J8P3M0_HALGN|nr:hypothetical protein FGO68_gene11043 [Halteria grandinella]